MQEPQPFWQFYLRSWSVLGKLKWEDDFLLLATSLSGGVTSHSRAVELCAQVLEKRCCKPVSRCHLVTPTGTGGWGNYIRLACAINQLIHSTNLPPNSSSGSCSDEGVGGMTQSPRSNFWYFMLNSDVVIHKHAEHLKLQTEMPIPLDKCSQKHCSVHAVAFVPNG